MFVCLEVWKINLSFQEIILIFNTMLSIRVSQAFLLLSLLHFITSLPVRYQSLELLLNQYDATVIEMGALEYSIVLCKRTSWSGFLIRSMYTHWSWFCNTSLPYTNQMTQTHLKACCKSFHNALKKSVVCGTCQSQVGQKSQTIQKSRWNYSWIFVIISNQLNNYQRNWSPISQNTIKKIHLHVTL